MIEFVKEVDKLKAEQKKIDTAIKAIEDLCLACEHHSDSCYVAIARRSMATLKNK